VDHLRHQDADEWGDLLKSYVKPSGQVLIIQVDPDSRSGWMSKRFWGWLEKDQSLILTALTH